MDADTTSPPVAISSDASAPVTGPFSITVAFSEPVTGFELEDLVARDAGGNPSAAAVQFSIVAELTPVPALPVIGALALALLLLDGGARRRTAS